MDTLIIADFIALTISGFMIGNEIAVGIFVHPQLRKLNKETHIKVVQPLAKTFGKIMPFWYFLTFLTSAWLTYLLSGEDNPAGFQFGLVASILWLLAIALTILILVPINSRVAKWNVNNLPEDWEKQRYKWDQWHLVRILLLIIAFIFLLKAVLTGSSV